MELLPLIDERDDIIVLTGFAERHWAESMNLPHLTTLLIPVRKDEDGKRTVEIQIRDARKSFPGCRDVFGGHVCVEAEFFTLLVGQPFNLTELILRGAIREANEELRMQNSTTGFPRDLQPEDLQMIGGIGEAKWSAPGNVERSTIFLVPIPNSHRIHPMDNDHTEFFPVSTQSWTWEDVREHFRNHAQYAYKDRAIANNAGFESNKNGWQFADGVARVLENDRLFEMVQLGIADLPDSAFEAPIG